MLPADLGDHHVAPVGELRRHGLGVPALGAEVELARDLTAQLVDDGEQVEVPFQIAHGPEEGAQVR